MMSSNTGQIQTPPGYNKSRRDIARLILTLVAIALLCGEQLLATFFSGAAILVLKEGTLFSIKNIKWTLLSAVSFAASLISLNMERGSNAVDEDRAYTLKMVMWLAAKTIQTGWGVTLGFFLFSAYAAIPEM